MAQCSKQSQRTHAGDVPNGAGIKVAAPQLHIARSVYFKNNFIMYFNLHSTGFFPARQADISLPLRPDKKALTSPSFNFINIAG